MNYKFNFINCCGESNKCKRRMLIAQIELRELIKSPGSVRKLEVDHFLRTIQNPFLSVDLQQAQED